jgi:hypothetical protein
MRTSSWRRWPKAWCPHSSVAPPRSQRPRVRPRLARARFGPQGSQVAPGRSVPWPLLGRIGALGVLRCPLLSEERTSNIEQPLIWINGI